METTLRARDFSNFIKCLSLLKDICNDVEIKGGVLRQRSNDHASIFEMDLSPLISGSDIVLPNLKSKLPMLNRLSKQGEVKITTTDNDISFSGQRSIIKFETPRLDYLDNSFMPSQDFANLFTLREEDLLLEYAVNKETSDLMKVISSQFNTVSFQVFFEGNTASITASTSSKDQYSQIESGIPVKKPSQGFSNIITKPFLIDHDEDILCKMYNVQENIIIDKFMASVGKVNVNVYCRSQLIEEREEENSSSKKKEGINKTSDGMGEEMGTLTEEGQEEKSDSDN